MVQRMFFVNRLDFGFLIVVLYVYFVVLFEMFLQRFLGVGKILLFPTVPVAITTVCHMGIAAKADMYAVGHLEMMN